MIERILELIQLKKMSPSQLADAIGVQRSNISHFVSGRNKPSLEFIIKVLNFFQDVNPDWLLFGKSPVFRDVFEIRKNVSLTPQGEKTEELSPEKIIEQAQSSIMEDLFSNDQDKMATRSFNDIQRANNKAVNHVDKSIPAVESPKKGKEKTSLPQGKNREERKTDKIVIFYNDRTFSEFFPE